MSAHTCGPAWFQDDYYSPDGHYIECEDARPHLEPIVDWIGDFPCSHGEREDGTEACLCGHPDFMTCPYVLAGHGILDAEIKPRDQA